jgi:tRNA pseudouridine38-40 synthase
VREVRTARWLLTPPQHDGEVWFEITAGSFLHTMVRVAVGSMVDVAQGRLSASQFTEALARGERRHMGQTAPARGLALIAVDY